MREHDLTEDLRETLLNRLAQRIHEVVSAENRPSPSKGDVYTSLEKLHDEKKLQKHMSRMHVDEGKLVVTHGVLAELRKVLTREHEPVLRSLRRLAEAVSFEYKTVYVKGRRVKGVPMPRELIGSKLLTADDILTKYEEGIEQLILEGRLELSEEAIVKYLTERSVEKETAR